MLSRLAKALRPRHSQNKGHGSRWWSFVENIFTIVISLLAKYISKFLGKL